MFPMVTKLLLIERDMFQVTLNTFLHFLEKSRHSFKTLDSKKVGRKHAKVVPKEAKGGPGDQNRHKNDKNTVLEPTSGKGTENAWKWRPSGPQKVCFRARGATFFTISTDPRNESPKGPKYLLKWSLNR